MTSESTPEPDPRRKRALVIGGIIAVAAIGWNIEGWGDNDDVHISVSGDDRATHEVRDAIRSEIREEIRSGFRGNREADEDEAAPETAEESDEESDESTDETNTDAADGERRLVETESSENQRSFRIEGDDGRGVTISVDTDPAE